MGLILRTGLRVGLGQNVQSSRVSVEGQPIGRWGSAPNTFSVGRAARAVGPTILIWLKGKSRLSSHKFQSHGKAQAHRRGFIDPKDPFCMPLYLLSDKTSSQSIK